jgi:hypothetical protein
MQDRSPGDLKKIRLVLVGDHALQHGLVGGIGNHVRVQFVLSFARLGGEDVPGKCVAPDNLPRPGLFEPFGRTFMGLEFGHENIPGKQKFNTIPIVSARRRRLPDRQLSRAQFFQFFFGCAG